MGGGGATGSSTPKLQARSTKSEAIFISWSESKLLSPRAQTSAKTTVSVSPGCIANGPVNAWNRRSLGEMGAAQSGVGQRSLQ